MKIPLEQIDAFAEKTFQGNPAAVCLLEEWLPDPLLQAIAAENNLAETAYCVKEADGYRIRWFTPTIEVDLCGHATLAAARTLFDSGITDGNILRFHSRSGELRVEREGDLLTLDFPARPAAPCPIPSVLTEILGDRIVECLRSTDYLVVLESETQVRTLTPDLTRIATLDSRGLIVTAAGDDCDFASRFFAPQSGINEDPVTGSAHCTLAPYWSERLGKHDLSARQVSARGGNLRCRLVGDRVSISGKAIRYLRGEIEIEPFPPTHKNTRC